MKKCPNCQQLFDDENRFCLECGTTLLLDTGNNPPIVSTGNTAPTQFIPRTSVNVPAKNPTTTYILVGAMGSLILCLVGFIFFLMFSKSVDEKANNNTAEINDNSEKTVKSNKTSKENNDLPDEKSQTPKPVELPPLTTEAVESLVARWEKSQDAKNFNTYKSCYSDQFLGIKRTKQGGEKRMSYSQWMKDRGQMMKNLIDVDVQNLQISTEDDTATATFTQQFESVNYQDTGQKVLKIKMFPDGAKIIYEDLKYSY